MHIKEISAPKIESDDLCLADLFKDFYQVPDFQREYVWESDNVEKLLTDVLDEFYDEQNQLAGDSEYFIGSIVGCRDDSRAFQLIDGQQRLTTIYLIICAVRDALLDLDEQSTKSIDEWIKSVAMDPRTAEDVSRFRLVLQYEDSHHVLETLAESRMPIENIPPSTESVRHICAAYKTIREFVRTNFQEDNAKIKKFLSAFMHRVKLIRIVTPSLAHALKVFETINDRGVGLNAMDLLKNLLFMRTKSEEYRRLKERWQELIRILDKANEKPLRFLRYYVLSQHETDTRRGLREDEIYDWLVEYEKAIGVDRNPIGFVDRLVECASAYCNFLNGRDKDGALVPYLGNISRLAGGAVRQHLILLMAAMDLPYALFVELCRNVENLFFCYLVIREPTKTFERSFARWSEELRAVKDEPGLHDFIKKYFFGEMVPRIKAVEFALAGLQESRIQQYRLRYILAKLTQHIDQLAWDNAAHTTLDQYLESAVHIEHILPQKPKPELKECFDKPDQYDEYVEKLGNLTLLERTINTSIGRGTFTDKKLAYGESTFLLTKSLAGRPNVGVDTRLNRAVRDLPVFTDWKSTDIDGRQQALVRLAREIWLRDVPTAITENKQESVRTVNTR